MPTLPILIPFQEKTDILTAIFNIPNLFQIINETQNTSDADDHWKEQIKKSLDRWWPSKVTFNSNDFFHWIENLIIGKRTDVYVENNKIVDKITTRVEQETFLRKLFKITGFFDKINQTQKKHFTEAELMAAIRQNVYELWPTKHRLSNYINRLLYGSAATELPKNINLNKFISNTSNSFRKNRLAIAPWIENAEQLETRRLEETTLELARRQQELERQKHASNAITFAKDIVAEILTFLPGKSYFSKEPAITYKYKQIIPQLLIILNEQLILTEQKTWDSYFENIKTECFKEYLINFLNQLITPSEGRRNLSEEVLEILENDKIKGLALAIQQGIIKNLKENIVFLEDIPVRFKKEDSERHAKCENSFKNVPMDNLRATLSSLPTDTIDLETITQYRELIDVIRRWHFAEYKRKEKGIESSFKKLIDDVAMKLTQREILLLKKTEGSDSVIADVNRIMSELEILIRDNSRFLETFNHIKIGIKEEVKNILVVKPYTIDTIVANITSICFKEYFMEFLVLVGDPMRENSDKPLVNPAITRIKILATVIVDGFVETSREKITFKNKLPAEFSNVEYRKKYPKCELQFKQRFRNSDSIVKAGYSSLPSAMFTTTPQQARYKSVMEKIYINILRNLPNTRNMTAIINEIKSKCFQDTLKVYIDTAPVTIPADTLAAGLADALTKDCHAFLGTLIDGTMESFVNAIDRDQRDLINYSDRLQKLLPIYFNTNKHNDDIERVLTVFARDIFNSITNPTVASLRSFIIGKRPALANVRPTAPASVPGAPADDDEGMPISELPLPVHAYANWKGGRSRSHKKSHRKIRGHVTRRGRRAHSVLRGPRTITIKGKKNSRRAARRTRRRSAA